MESEEELRDRLVFMEKRVEEQNNELIQMRSTLSQVLSRLSALEVLQSREAFPVRSAQQLKTVKDTNNTFSSNQTARDFVRRQIISSGKPRNSVLHRSNGSLASDGTSSNSASPAPSPSPTQYRQQVSDAENGSRLKGTSLKPSKFRTSIESQLNSFHVSKRWNSTSDFAPTKSLISRRLDSTSLVNLNAKNLGPSLSKSNGGRDLVYESEEGIVRFFSRGHYVNFYIPNSLREIYSPTPPSTLPKWKLKMEWVYGYRGKDCRSNLFVLPTGEVVYFTASVIVLLNMDEHGQRFYLGHTGEVKCLTVHPNKLLVASGQGENRDVDGGRSHVRIWNSVSLQTLFVIGLGHFDKSISCLAFSKADGGNILLVVDDAPDHNISLWNWQKTDRGHRMTESRSSSDVVVAVEWNPFAKERFAFVTCGKSHVCFWSLDNGCLSRTFGIFDSRDKPKYVTCLVFADNGDLLSGDSNGCIIVWSKGSNVVLKTLRNAHEGPVFCLSTLKDGRIVSGGGKDGQLVLWDFPSYRRTGYVVEVPVQYGHVRTVVQGKGSHLLVGTTRNCILKGTFDSALTPLIVGHTEDVLGLCCHPSQSQFLSAGCDGHVRLMDTMSRTLIWDKHVGHPIQSACFSPDGSVVVLATNCGKWFVMDAETRDLMAEFNDGTEPLQVVKYSPNGKLMAVGSRDHTIYVYTVYDNYRKYDRAGRCVGHTSAVRHMDWSNDSVHLKSNAGSQSELLFWNAVICRQIAQPSTMRDVEWNSNTCTFEFSTLGVWPEDLVDVSCCSASKSRSVLVSGDVLGRIRLFAYPTHQLKSPYHSYSGHLDVTAVALLHDDTRVVTTGGRDSSVIQWCLEKLSS